MVNPILGAASSTLNLIELEPASFVALPSDQRPAIFSSSTAQARTCQFLVSKAVSGETIYGDEAEIIVKDDILSEVLVNGERVEIKNNQAIPQLASNGGEEKYEIVSTDIAGNQSKIQITVAAEWMKKKIIPSGVKVRLSQECAYTLGSGTWKVSGDGTEYSGGNTFYVRSDGEYSFTKTN